MTRIATVVVSALALGAGLKALAEPAAYSFDMSHSRIFFDIDHRGFSVMQGRFGEFGGSFMYDAANPAMSSLDITIAADSIDMFFEPLNNHLKTGDFFNVEQYPELRFVSERVEVAADDRFTVHGNLTMLGQTHPVSFDVVLNQMGQGRGGLPMAGFTATGTIDRTLFGMNYGVPAVGSEVSFRIEIEAGAAG
jgi:polyisoprenoid-binding protein YceI